MLDARRPPPEGQGAGAADAARSGRHVVVHIDVDSFFVQAEQLRDPDLAGLPLAIQQHGDIIAANALAKDAGVRKHCAPAEARRLLAACGGRVVHVHVSDGYRISYAPYRNLSRRFHALLHSLPGASVVERASIDEAFVLVAPAAATDVEAPDTLLPLRLGEDYGRDARARCAAELGLAVSVGVARNRFLAKLTTATAKPDGMRVTDGAAAVQRLLEAAPVTRIPGYGGQVAAKLREHGIAAVAALQGMSVPALQALCGLAPGPAERLSDYGHGRDDQLPAVRPAPRTLSVQMSLTPVPRRMHPSWAGHAAASDEHGVLQPMLIAAPDTLPRMSSLLAQMIADLLDRVRIDSDEEGRWPTLLVLKIRTQDPGGKMCSKSARIPSSGDAGILDRLVASCKALFQQQHQLAVGFRQQIATAAVQDISHSCTRAAAIVEVHCAASRFLPLSSTLMQPLTSLLGKPGLGAERDARQQDGSVCLVGDAEVPDSGQARNEAAPVRSTSADLMAIESPDCDHGDRSSPRPRAPSLDSGGAFTDDALPARDAAQPRKRSREAPSAEIEGSQLRLDYDWLDVTSAADQAFHDLPQLKALTSALQQTLR